MMFRELMAEFAGRIGLEEPVEIDEEGFCSFGFGDATVAMQGMDELETLALSADVGAPPPERLEQLYGEMLKANYNFAGTNGATLSLDPRTGSAHLCRCVPYSALGGDRLETFVLDFITALADWRRRVRDFRADDGFAAADGAIAGGDGLFRV